jgi:hypothetical protein
MLKKAPILSAAFVKRFAEKMRTASDPKKINN